MAARIFLTIIALLTLLVVGGAFIFYQYGDRFLAEQSMPTVEFEAPPPEEQPLYADLDNWLARPGVEQELTGWEPEEIENYSTPLPVEEEETAEPVDPDELPEVATFYVHPTTYLQRDRWNGPMQLEGDNAFRTRLFVQTQASAFASLGPIWAPRYRQAAYGAFLSREPDAVRALDVSYTDVKDAFEMFIDENPEGPLLLAGHSQGALHLLRLLSEYGVSLRERLVAAYVVGWPVDMEADLPATGLPLCEGPNQAGCIMTWLTFGDPPNPGLVVRDWEQSEGYADAMQRSRERVACTNPISGGEALEDAIVGRGTLVPTQGLLEAKMLVGAIAAQCRDGLLILQGEVPDIGPYVLPGNNYHPYDYALFWADVRADAEARRLAWSSAE